jgi:hypothetical protein
MRSTIIKFLFAAVAFAAFAGMSVNAQSFAGGRRPTNMRTLEDRIFKEIITLPRYGVFDHITFQVSGNTVILGGNVNSLGTKRSAENAVRRIPGVERVINNIRNLPPSGFDNQIRRQLVREFGRHGSVYRYLQGPNPSVRLIVDRGHVSLEGYVSNRSDAGLINVIANGIPGVFSVRNNLIVESDRVR